MSEARKFPRLDKKWEINYRKISPEEIESNPVSSYTVNISGGGVCFETEEEIPEGTILALELKSEAFPSPVIVLAKAVWCNKKIWREKYKVGLEFWWTGWKDNSAQEEIAEYIRGQTS